jgi:hypothetical protein
MCRMPFVWRFCTRAIESPRENGTFELQSEAWLGSSKSLYSAPESRVPRGWGFFCARCPHNRSPPLEISKTIPTWLAGPQRGILGASLVLHSLYRVAPLSPVLSIPRVRRAPTSLRSGLFL